MFTTILIGFFAAANVLIWSEVLYRTESLHLWAGRWNPSRPGTGTEARHRDSSDDPEPAFRSAAPISVDKRPHSLTLRWS